MVFLLHYHGNNSFLKKVVSMNKQVDFKKISKHKVPMESLGFLLWRISLCWRSKIETSLKKHDLTHPQFVMLASLAWLTKQGDMVSQAEVGKMAGVDPNTTSQILRGLETKQLIKRVRKQDERSKNPMLTSEGAKRLSVAMPKAVENIDEMFFNPLTKKESQQLLILFQKLFLHHDVNE